jgi:hypothetical protein
LSVADDMTIRLIEGWSSDAFDLQGHTPGFTRLGLLPADGCPDPKLGEAVKNIMTRQVTVRSNCQSELWDASRRRCYRYRLTPLGGQIRSICKLLDLKDDTVMRQKLRLSDGGNRSRI